MYFSVSLFFSFSPRISLTAASHCCHFDKFSNFIAIGTTVGGVSIYSFLTNTLASSSGEMSVDTFLYVLMDIRI
jgi:hypothetical protein